MPVKASYLAIVGGGAIVAISGIKGWNISHAFRDVITGKNPNTNPQPASQIQSASVGTITIGGGNTGLPTGTVGSGPIGPGENGFFTAVLTAIGAPATKANLLSFHNWRVRESPWNASPPDGAQYTHNPLNTTLLTSGAIGTVNSIGVRIYKSAVAGIIATARTLLGGYPAIVSDLRKGIGLNTGNPAVASELLTWSGGGYSSV